METSSGRSSISSPVLNSVTISDKDQQILSTKYTKLAAEYSKVRAQLGVLKKAVLEEQAKNVGACENVKQKDQSLRKSEAEMDSLTFRNQQLTRRVEILQEDLERKIVGGHGGSSRKKIVGPDIAASHLNTSGNSTNIVSGHLDRDQDKVSVSESLNSVMGEELQLKIAENARLHAALDGVDKRYEERLGSLQSKVKELEVTASKQAQSERADDARLKELVHGLKVENADLLSRLKKLELEHEDKNDRITMLKVQLESSMNIGCERGNTDEAFGGKNQHSDEQYGGITATLSEANIQNSISQRLAISTVESEPCESSLPPPLTSTEARIHTVEILSQIGENVQEVIAALSDLHTYWEHRIKDTHNSGQVWTENSKNLQKHLLENVRYLKPIEAAYNGVLSSLLTSAANDNSASTLSLPFWFSAFAINLENYVRYAQNTIEPLIIGSLSEESGKISCSTTQQSANNCVQAAIRSFNSNLSEVASQIKGLTENEDGTAKKCAPFLQHVSTIANGISQLAITSSILSSEYQSKASDEAELPTVSSALRNTNQCVVSATVSLTSGLEHLSRNLSDYVPKIAALAKANFDLMVSDNSPFENINDPKDSLSLQPSKSIITPLIGGDLTKHSEMVHDLKEKVESLSQYIENSNEKHKKSEQEKEHWKVEYQLVQMKLDNMKQKLEEKEDQISDNSTDVKSLDLGIIVSGDKRVYEDRIAELVADRILADSKATHFFLECMALQKKIQSREIKAVRTCFMV